MEQRLGPDVGQLSKIRTKTPEVITLKEDLTTIEGKLSYERGSRVSVSVRPSGTPKPCLPPSRVDTLVEMYLWY